MGKTIIRVGCIDQRLILASTPKIASGGKNEDKIVFEFCSLWTGFEKVAIFYRDPDHVYSMLIDSENSCVIPWEVLADEGEFFFGVFGVKDDITRTSEIVRYKVEKGAITEATEISDPTPDMYEQILAACQAVLAGLDVKFNAKADKIHKHDVTDVTGALPLSGGTMTGNLHIKLNYGGVYLADGDGNVNGYLTGSKDDSNVRRMRLAVHGTDADFYEFYAVPVSTSGLSGHKYYDILTSKKPVTVAQGGTGADNGGDGLVNLGLEIDNGKTSASASAKTVYFNTEFSNAPCVVATSTDPNCIPVVTSVGTTSFSIQLVGINGTIGSAPVYWIAVLNKNNMGGI